MWVGPIEPLEPVPESRKVILARVRGRTNRAVSLLADAYRQWWRPFRNARRRREARWLLALNAIDLDDLPSPPKRERERTAMFFRRV